MELRRSQVYNTRVTKTRFLNNQNLKISNTFKHVFKNTKHSLKHKTLLHSDTPPHPNPHSTKDAPFIGGQKTLSHPLSLRTKSVNLTLLSKSLLSLPFCQNPSLFVSFQHPRLIYIPLTKVQIFSMYRYLCLSVTHHRAPKFQFLSYVFSFLCSFIVGPNFFVLLVFFFFFWVPYTLFHL